MNTNNYFNLNKFIQGEKTTTKLGNPVRYITSLRDGRILVEITPRSRIVEHKTIKYSVPTSEKYTAKYWADGKKYKNYDCEYDLVMSKPVRPRDAKGRFVKL